MSEVKCPYCGEWQEINHDDGNGYDESIEHEQNCVGCSHWFKFTTSIMYCYEVFCQNGDHEMVQALDDSPDFFTCEKCDHSELKRNDKETCNV